MREEIFLCISNPNAVIRGPLRRKLDSFAGGCRIRNKKQESRIISELSDGPKL